MLDLCAGAWEEEDAPPCLLVQQTEGISGGGEATGGVGREGAQIKPLSP